MFTLLLKKSLHRGVEEHRNEGRLCSTIHGYRQKKELYLKKASIHTPEMTGIKIALKEIHKKENKRWVIYTDFLSFMQSINTIKKIYQY